MDEEYGYPVLDQKAGKTLEVKPWKVLPNRVKNMKQITGEMGIIWMYCPMEKNLADLGSKEARIKKMETVGGSQVPNGY